MRNLTPVFILMIMLTSLASASVPNLISFQGRLTDITGNPVTDGTYDLTFKLYLSPTDPADLWAETHSGVSVAGGLYHVLLGSVTSIVPVDFRQQLYLGLSVGADPEMTPRYQLASSPSALAIPDHVQATTYNGHEIGHNNGNLPIADGTLNTDLNTDLVDGQHASDFSLTAHTHNHNTLDNLQQAGPGVINGHVSNLTQTIDGTKKFSNAPSAPSYTSTALTGTAPFTVTSTTLSPNLNADLLDGQHGADFTQGSGTADYLPVSTGSNTLGTSRILQTSSMYGINFIADLPHSPALQVRPVGGVGEIAIYGHNYSGPTNDGIRWDSYTSIGGAAIAGFNQIAGAYKAGVYGLAVLSGSHNIGGVVGSLGGIPIFGGLGYYDGTRNWAGYFGGNIYTSGQYTSSLAAGTAPFAVTSTDLNTNLNADLLDGQHSLWTDDGAGIHPNNNPHVSIMDTGNIDYHLYISQDSIARSAIYAYDGSAIAGTGYNYNAARSTICALSRAERDYNFALYGQQQENGRRSGGAIGITHGMGGGMIWGSLGYMNSSGTPYGGYGTSGFITGTGFLRPGEDEEIKSGIGSGWYGDLMGGWVRGDLLGFTACGRDYAAYNLGDAYTSGLIATVQTVGSERVAAYAATGPEVEVYTRGLGKLVAGRAEVPFDAEFIGLISAEMPVTVTLTPVKAYAQLYLESMNNRGFVVRDAQGSSGGTFTWIAVGRKVGYEQRPTLPASVARIDFDDLMKRVMFNENDQVNSAQPFWWDGSQYRTDPIPQSQGER